MDKYRSQIKWRIFLGAIIIVFSVCLGILDQIGVFDKIGFFKKFENISAFQLGFLTGISLVALVMIFRYAKVLKNDAKLQMLYNEENDERLGFIRQKSGMPMLMITSCIMIFAGIVAGYINEMVFYTLVIAAMIQIALSAIVKIYYMRKI